MPATPKTPKKEKEEKPYDRSSSPEDKPKARRTPTKAKGIAWTGEENYKLFQKLHPKASVNWADVAEYVGNGRDAKVSLCHGVRSDKESCQNRYAIMQKQLPKLFQKKM